MKRLLTIYLALYSAVYIISWLRPDAIAQATNHTGFALWRFIPMVVLLILAFSLYVDKWNKKLNLKPFIIGGFVLLPILLVLDFLNSRHIIISGTFMSVGLIYAFAVLAAYRLRDNGTRALLIGILWGFCFMYSWEMVYQTALYINSGATLPGYVGSLMPSLGMAFPFALIIWLFNPRPNKYLLLIMGALLFVMVLWVATGLHTFILYKNGGWVEESTNHFAYILNRVSKVLSGALILGLDFKSIGGNIGKE